MSVVAPWRERLSSITGRVSGRARWALVDQALVSGSNLLTGLFLARFLGFEAFGIYSLVLIWVQLAASLQMSAILAPMMTCYPKKGDIGREAYLGALLLHQLVFLVLSLCLWFAASGFMAATGSPIELPVPFVLIAGLFVASQLQDLFRRYFYASDRPILAFISDLIAYAGRLLFLAVAAFGGQVGLDVAFEIIAGMYLLACAPVLRDLFRMRLSARLALRVATIHRPLSVWMSGSALAQWFSGNFFLVIVAAVAGPVALGGVRAVQNLIAVTHIMMQALENFVPVSATRIFLAGGAEKLAGYLRRLVVWGASAIMAVALGMALLAEPIMQLVYGQQFSDQSLIMVVLALQYILAHVNFSLVVGLRTLNDASATFWANAVAGIVSLLVAFPLTETFGVIGALCGILGSRILVALWHFFAFWRLLRVS